MLLLEKQKLKPQHENKSTSSSSENVNNHTEHEAMDTCVEALNNMDTCSSPAEVGHIDAIADDLEEREMIINALNEELTNFPEFHEGFFVSYRKITYFNVL